MSSRLSKGAFAVLAACLCAGAGAAEKSNEADALALIKSAQAYLKTNGLEKASAEFNRPDSPYNSKSELNKFGDLYLFSLDQTGFLAIHGVNSRLRGTNKMDLRDQDGVYLIRDMVKLCFGKEGKGWVNYRWPNPISKEMEAKSSYIERVPDTPLCLGTGIYK